MDKEGKVYFIYKALIRADNGLSEEDKKELTHWLIEYYCEIPFKAEAKTKLSVIKQLVVLCFSDEVKRKFL